MTLMFCECVVLYRNINKKGCHYVMLVHLFCEVYFFTQCTEIYLERTRLKNTFLHI